jgi:hypothetical protein
VHERTDELDSPVHTADLRGDGVIGSVSWPGQIDGWTAISNWPRAVNTASALLTPS